MDASSVRFWFFAGNISLNVSDSLRDKQVNTRYTNSHYAVNRSQNVLKVEYNVNGGIGLTV